MRTVPYPGSSILFNEGIQFPAFKKAFFQAGSLIHGLQRRILDLKDWKKTSNNFLHFKQEILELFLGSEFNFFRVGSGSTEKKRNLKLDLKKPETSVI